MKRRLTLIFTLVMLLTLTACGVSIGDLLGSGDSPSGSGQQQEHSGTPAPDVKEPNETPAAGETPEQSDPAPSETPGTVPDKGGDDDHPQVTLVPRPGTEEAPPTVRETPESLWDKLGGCWVAVDDDRFAYFTYTDDGPAFWGGEWESPDVFRRGAGTVTGLTAFEGGIFTLSVTYPPIEEDAADEQDLQPLLYTMGLDISRLEEGIVRVEAPEDQWRSYTWGGVSYDDAYDATYSGVSYATFGEMQELWAELGGYWVDDDGRFILFDQMDSNTLLFSSGVQSAGWGQGMGTFEKAMTSFGEIPLEFIVYYAPIENELDGSLPARYQSVFLDITDLYTKNTLHVQLGEDGEWVAYTYAGYTLDG